MEEVLPIRRPHERLRTETKKEPDDESGFRLFVFAFLINGAISAALKGSLRWLLCQFHRSGQYSASVQVGTCGPDNKKNAGQMPGKYSCLLWFL
jgi:hypothetical protein